MYNRGPLTKAFKLVLGKKRRFLGTNGCGERTYAWGD